MSYLRFFLMILVLIAFYSCDNEKPRWVFSEEDVGKADTEENDEDISDDTDSFEENDTRRSDVRCGDEFGGYYEEIYIGGKWELTEKCLHPQFNVSLIDDMNVSNNDLIPVFMKDMGEKLFIYTIEKQGDEFQPVILTTDGTAAGTELFCSNMKNSYKLSLFNLYFEYYMTKINEDIYYMGLDLTGEAFVLYKVNSNTCESTNLTEEIEGLDPIAFSGIFEDHYILYGFSDILVIFSHSDKKAYFINIENLTLENVIGDTSPFYVNFAIGEKLFFETENEDGSLNLIVFDKSDMSFKTIFSSIEGHKIEDMKFIKGESHALFTLSTFENGCSLWITDGTVEGTLLIEEDEKVGSLYFGKEVDGIFYYFDEINSNLLRVESDLSTVKVLANIDKTVFRQEFVTVGGKVYIQTYDFIETYRLSDGKLLSETNAGESSPLLLVEGDKVSFISSEEDTSVAFYEEKSGSFIKTGTIIDTSKKISSHNTVSHRFRLLSEKDGVSLISVSEYLSNLYGDTWDYKLTNQYLLKTDGTFSGTEIIESKWEIGQGKHDYVAKFYKDQLIHAAVDENGDSFLKKHNSFGDDETFFRLSTQGTKNADVELSASANESVYFSIVDHNGVSADQGTLYLLSGEELLNTEFADTEIPYEDAVDDYSFIDEFRAVGKGVFAVREKELIYVEENKATTLSYNDKGLEESWINLNYSNDDELYFSLEYSTIIDSVSATREFHFRADRNGVVEITEINDLIRDKTKGVKGFHILSKIDDTLILAAELSNDVQSSAICFLSSEGAITWGPESLLKVSSRVFIPKNDNFVFFTGNTADEGWEAWTTDGTVSGTKILFDANPGSEGSPLDWLYEVDGALFIQADEKLWRTDIKTKKTEFVAKFDGFEKYRGKFLADNKDGYFAGLKLVCASRSDCNTELIFTRINSNGAIFQLYKEFVTEFEIKDFRLFNGLFFIELADEDHIEIYAADGRKHGLIKMSEYVEDFPTDNNNLTFSENYIFFTGSSEDHGNEPRKLTVTYE